MDEITIAESNPNWIGSFERESVSIWAVLDRDLVMRRAFWQIMPD